MSNCKFPNAREADRRFGQVFITLVQGQVDTTTFRRLCQLGMPLAKAHLHGQNTESVARMAAEGELDKFFISREAALAHFGGVEGFASSMTANQIDGYRRSVDTASIVFAHSAVDAAVTELCWITAFASPADWDKYVANRKVSIADAKAGIDQALAQVLADHLSQFERESLMSRVDRLFALCQPEQGWESMRGFRFDRNRLEILDQLRHKLIHHQVDPSELSTAEQDADYMFKAAMHIWGMVNAKYKVKIDVRDLLPESVREALGEFAPDAPSRNR